MGERGQGMRDGMSSGGSKKWSLVGTRGEVSERCSFGGSRKT